MASRTRLSLRLRCHGFKGRALNFTRAEESLGTRLRGPRNEASLKHHMRYDAGGVWHRQLAHAVSCTLRPKASWKRPLTKLAIDLGLTGFPELI